MIAMSCPALVLTRHDSTPRIGTAAGLNQLAGERRRHGWRGAVREPERPDPRPELAVQSVGPVTLAT